MTNLVYVTYYTRSNGYEEIAREYLLKSMDKLDLPVDIEVVDPFPSWLDALRFKGDIVKRKCEEYPDKAVVWIDVDMKVYSDPTAYFEKIANECDVAAYVGDTGLVGFQEKCRWAHYSMLSSALVLFSPTPMRARVLEMWLDLMPRSPHSLDQTILQRVIECLKPEGLRFIDLPLEYLWVNQNTLLIDSYRQNHTGAGPVIEAFYAHDSQWRHSPAVTSSAAPQNNS